MTEFQIQMIRINKTDKRGNFFTGTFPYQEQVINVATIPLDI